MLSGDVPVSSSEESLFDFTITNSTPSCVSLTFQGTDCGCVGVLFLGEPIQAGAGFVLDSGSSLNVSFEIKIPSSVGQFAHKAVFVPEINGRKTDPILLCVSGNVLPQISLVPPSVQVDFCKEKLTDVTETLTITRNILAEKAPALPLPALESLPSFVQVVEIKSVNAAKKENGVFSQTWQAKLNISAKSFSKNATQITQAQVVFPKTENIPYYTCDFPVLVRYQVGVDFPDEILFGICAIGDFIDRKIFLRSTDERPFRILTAECDSDLFEIKTIPSDLHTSFWLNVSFKPSSSGEHHGRLVVKTDHPSVRSLQIALKGIAK